jgi:hypothetical protein
MEVLEFIRHSLVYYQQLSLFWQFFVITLLILGSFASFVIVGKVLLFVFDFFGNLLYDYEFHFSHLVVLLLTGSVGGTFYLYMMYHTEYRTHYNDVQTRHEYEPKLTMNKVQDYFPHANVNHLQEIYKQSQYFNMDYRYMIAIAATESSFVPTVVSSSNAYGLFQVKLSTAQETAEKMLGLNEYITKRTLLNEVDKNIKIGIAYSKYLQLTYLYNVENSTKRMLLTLYGYHGGINRILDIFHYDHQVAQEYINALSRKEMIEYLDGKLRKKGFSQTIEYPKKILAYVDLFSEVQRFQLVTDRNMKFCLLNIFQAWKNFLL